MRTARPAWALALALAVALTLAGCAEAPSSRAIASAPVERSAPTSTVAAPTTTTLPPVAESPEGVAARLGAVETAIRDPATPEADLAALGREQQGLYRLLVRNPDWQATVAGLVPAPLRPAVEANAMAGIELAKLSRPVPQLPKWRIVPPLPASELLTEYKAAQKAVGVPWEYLAAIHLVETRMGRIRGDSSAGAKGPMQFLPSTWAIYGRGGDINSTHDSILAAARLLRSRGAPDNMGAALYAYNPSQRYVRAVTAYAGIMAANERTYLAYHAWQVYYGDTLLPEGWVG
ncbi:MAG TPA: lytic transglycosylase domain-containing protein [Acidimicrobiales bacterium]|nr:lytic transglycosylase domain-containing protein [Acidimicrobiales bacterium]